MALASSLREAEQRLRHDAQRWLRAKSYDDLLRLNILLLEGKIVYQPGYVTYPEDLLEKDPPFLAKETSRIVHHLIALNRLGFFTDCSQPGDYSETNGFCFSRAGKRLPGSAAIEQRAFVSGYAPKALAHRWLAGLDDPHLVVLRERLRPTRRIVVTRQGRVDRPLRGFTRIGLAVPVELHRQGRIGPKALKELAQCIAIAAYDKKWRRDTHLWPALLTASEPKPRAT